MSTNSTMKNAQSRSMQHDVVAVDSDRGFTLPEVLIAVLLMSLLAAVLAAAMTVTLRQAASTEGRANVARAETAIDTWLPVDLGSTDLDNDDLPALTDDPAATPCGNCGTIDLGGTNAMQLAWENRDDSGAIYITRVQYQYFQEADGEWVIRRIECVGSDRCTVSVVLHDLDGPPDAGFTPGSQRPTWVFDVDVPVDDDATLSDNARQISVTIDGGGAADGAGGGLNTINLTSGGRSTEEIPADEFDSPSFTRATSRCGGPVTLFVDDSGSIGSNVNKVVKPEKLDEKLNELALRIASKSGRTLAIGKEAFYRQLEMPLDEAYAYASKVMTENMLDAEACEGIGAFLEKREPKWPT